MRNSKRGYANLAVTLSFEFQKYLMRHPAVAKRIPRDAMIVFELKDHRSFNRWAREVADKQRCKNQEVVTVRVRSMTPPLSRIKAVELVC
jgi:hypothetical protein